jgi:hypothetical protein
LLVKKEHGKYLEFGELQIKVNPFLREIELFYVFDKQVYNAVHIKHYFSLQIFQYTKYLKLRILFKTGSVNILQQEKLKRPSAGSCKGCD